ncbi:hypothetical protein LQZ18_00465 [Lachnospiraceae bacterium ZAX-1]
MKKLIYSIFDNAKADIPQIEVAEGNITKEIESLLKPLKGRLTVEQYEEIRSPLFEAGLTAEREGFALGFGYAVHLLLGSIGVD